MKYQRPSNNAMPKVQILLPSGTVVKDTAFTWNQLPKESMYSDKIKINVCNFMVPFNIANNQAAPFNLVLK
jgi:hypothetical protein